MRTACCVTLFFVLSMCGAGFAQENADTTGGSLDRDVTVVGRDETALPVPPPGAPQEIVLPDVEPEQPTTPIVPPIQPPPDGTSGAADQSARDQSASAFP
jgi:hypothetical protein